MPQFGNALVVQRLLMTTVFKILRLVYIFIQKLYWELNGTANLLRESRDPEHYERCVQVFDVVWFHKFCLMRPNSLADFILTHSRFESPQYITDNDHITLMAVNAQHAVFCEAAQPGVHLWRSEFNAFIRYAQNKLCRRLLVVPLSAFHRMAETIGDPKAQLVFVFHTTRSGSTLLAQVMEYTGRCVSISEPDSPNYIATVFRKSGDSPGLRQLARDVIRWECRPYPSFQLPVLAYLLKFTSATALSLPLFKDLYPEAKCLFVYRDLLRSAKSACRVSLTLPTVHIALTLGRLSAKLTEVIVDAMGFNGKDFHIRLHNSVFAFIVVSIPLVKTYQTMRQRGFDISAIRYEDMVRRPLETCRVLMDYLGLPSSLAEPGLSGFQLDSQRNSPFAKSIIGHLKEPELSVESARIVNELLRKFELPILGEELILDGTINSTSCSAAFAGPINRICTAPK